MLEGVNPKRVPEPISELKQGIAVLVIQGGSRWLVSRNQDEALTVFEPGHVLDQIAKHSDILAIPSTEDLHILQHVLSVVALAGGVGHVL